MWISHETCTNKEPLWPIGLSIASFWGGGWALWRESITMNLGWMISMDERLCFRLDELVDKDVYIKV